MTQLEIEYKFHISSQQAQDMNVQLALLATHHYVIHKSDVYYRCKTINKDASSDASSDARGNASSDASSNASNDFCDIRLRRYTETSGERKSANKAKRKADNKEANEETSYFLTYKKGLNNYDDEGEVNEEFETKIEDYEVMEHLIMMLGGAVLVKKIKHGNAYIIPFTLDASYDASSDIGCDIDLEGVVIRAEVIEVESLGYFFEIEVVLDRGCLDMMPNTIPDTYITLIQKKLLTMSYALGIAPSQLEKKKYMELLIASW